MISNEVGKEQFDLCRSEEASRASLPTIPESKATLQRRESYFVPLLWTGTVFVKEA